MLGITEPLHDVDKWLLCPWAGLSFFMVETAAASLGERQEHHCPFPVRKWSPSFPAAKPYVVLVLSKFSGTDLSSQLGFMLHFILSRW